MECNDCGAYRSGFLRIDKYNCTFCGVYDEETREV